MKGIILRNKLVMKVTMQVYIIIIIITAYYIIYSENKM